MSKVISRNPSRNYEVIGEVDFSTELEIKEKVSNSRKAFKSWKEIGIKKRVELLRKVQQAILARKEEIGVLTSKEMGMPISRSIPDVEDALLNYMEWYLNNADEAIKPQITFENETEIHKNFYEPTGVAAVISPWNFPISNFVWGVVPNLLVGNTVVYKHSEECALTAKLMEEIISECNLPEGILSFVHGDGTIGEILLNQELDLISFTGSTKTGKHIYEFAGRKFIKCLVELGGSAPGIVFEDVDIDTIIPIISDQKMWNSGQICDGLKRLIVHESIFEELVDKLSRNLLTIKVGDAELPQTEMGPLVAERQLKLALEQLEDAKAKGAKVITGGKKPEGLEGAFLEPTILININPEMKVWKEEVFAPILPIVKFITEEEAIKLANDTSFGLGGYIHTKDLARASRVALQLETGMISVNGTNYVCPFNVFGGTKSSGKGREHGLIGLRELCEIKLVAMNK